MTQRPTALLIDFDGVLRTFDPSENAKIEQRYGLSPGTVLDTALEWDRLLPAITGRMTRAEWLASVAADLADRVGGLERATELMEQWQVYPGVIDPVVLAFVRDVRAAGLPVGLATNSTIEFRDVLEDFGLTGEFDAVAVSAELGVHKPAKEYFMAACGLVDTAPPRCMLIDDTDRMIRGARAAGLSGYRYTPGDDLSYPRRALGL
ncbi:HAD family hydrolase [Dactylosporangium matsuzakiense]|uniref:Hydrolase n=1 Tax=Dactylosporangium matsuzakiense TaxID=53360 RepID=A0A9W6NMA8_9ACTN|nr:HAD-IA family hydrolase [Dactylosporangium matsuzakiense]UWZ46319.1 HAD-IA family hydrolase [Dactylosporangium matsuzakiense]GLL02021.1 hydrolase [Dactylosporangium matsuzakiense]